MGLGMEGRLVSKLGSLELAEAVKGEDTARVYLGLLHKWRR